MTEGEALRLTQENDRLRKRLAEEESAHEVTTRQRDFAERWADKLASGVGDVEVIGEHSNLNNPWETAYGLMRSLAEFEAVEAERNQLREQVAKLQAFKDWVHNYLDSHGVPYHPPGPHGAEGCRIGDRMDWLMASWWCGEYRSKDAPADPVLGRSIADLGLSVRARKAIGRVANNSNSSVGVGASDDRPTRFLHRRRPHGCPQLRGGVAGGSPRTPRRVGSDAQWRPAAPAPRKFPAGRLSVGRKW